MAKRAFDLDDILENLNEKERRRTEREDKAHGKVKIGEVENYFSKISVVAVRLTGPLAVGDVIEIGNEENAIRQKVESMQIERRNVSLANAGGSVGILIRCKVSKGEEVYKMIK